MTVVVVVVVVVVVIVAVVAATVDSFNNILHCLIASSRERLIKHFSLYM